MPPKSKKKLPPKKAAKIASAASESDDDEQPIVVAKTSARRSGRQIVEEPKTTRASRGSQKENGSSKRVETSNNSTDSGSESDDEPVKAAPKNKSSPKKRKTDDGSEDGESSKPVRTNPRQIYEVEKIIAHEGNGTGRLYRIRWKGWGPEFDTWEPRKKLECPKLLAKYIAENPDAKQVFARKVKKSRKKKKIEKPPRVLKIDEQPDYDSEDNDEDGDWEVGRILDVRYHRDKSREFLIRWKNYSSNSDTWEPEAHLNCKELIQKFMDKLEKVAIGEPKELRQVRQVTQRYTLMTQSAERRLSKRNNNRQRAVYYDAEL